MWLFINICGIVKKKIKNVYYAFEDPDVRTHKKAKKVLGEKGPSDAGQVAFDACILAPSLSRIIGKLEKEKFISRVIDQKDGRRVNLLLTQLGQETLNKIVPDIDVVYKNIQKRYGEEKLAKLLELLGGVSEWRGR